VMSAAFSPDGSRIVTAAWGGTAGIWDATTWEEIAVLSHPPSVLSAAFNPDGSRIVTASGDTTARIWRLGFATMSTKDLLIEVCTRRLRGISTMTRNEMRLAGYPDSEPLIDVCAGVAEARQ
jgi:WD40 repeat protein